jgi:hypothetical protein
MLGTIVQGYSTIKKALVPTEQAANAILIVLLIITAYVLIKGSPVAKAAWAAWLIIP